MKFARLANQRLKERRKKAMALYLSPVRRIERATPVPGCRLVGMTFDDGPSAAPAVPGNGQGLSSLILDILAAFKARGTFNVVGSTACNYPDREGRTHSVYWSGIKYDHYPEFGQDHLAGVEAQLELARRAVAEGHELSNHSYSHVAFGPSRWIYGSRRFLPGLAAVIDDLHRLHQLVLQETGFTMKLARPPHYIDGIPGRKSAYDAYRELGYQYLAASFDGGGWRPSCGDYRQDVEDMVAPLRKALELDPESLNGQIIFQKDGYNMSKQTPVADALPLQLKVLSDYGYQVVTVSELLAQSPFSDLPAGHQAFPWASSLVQKGFNMAYRDNSFQPGRVLTRGELAEMVISPGLRTNLDQLVQPQFSDVPANHPYCREIHAAAKMGWMRGEGRVFHSDRPASLKDLEGILMNLPSATLTADLPFPSSTITRGLAMEILGPALLKSAGHFQQDFAKPPRIHF